MRHAIDSVQQLSPHMPRGVVLECANYPDKPWQGGTFEGCNIWRVSSDVPDSFEGWTSVIDRAVDEHINKHAGKLGAGSGAAQQWGGGWSSFDYLRIQTRHGRPSLAPGRPDKGILERGEGEEEDSGQTIPEYRAQMSMWAVLGMHIKRAL
jgi:hypothetical protein